MGQMHKLLVVDDDKMIADTTAFIFTQAGYEARAVDSAEEALELMQTWQPSAVILDMLLPKMDGIRLTKVIETNWPACQIVLFSSQDDFVDQLSYAQDPVSVIAKPVHPAELLSIVSALLTFGADEAS